MDFHAGHPEAAPQGERRHLPHPATCRDEWDFLKGSGPSAPEAAAREEFKYKPAPFHSNWNRKKPETNIGQYDERFQNETIRDNRNETCNEIRHQNLDEWNKKSHFNPVTGQELASDGVTWQAASNPWQHQKVGLKPTRQPGMSDEEMESKMQSAEVRRQMRAERIATNGLTTSLGIRTSSVQDNFEPTNM